MIFQIVGVTKKPPEFVNNIVMYIKCIFKITLIHLFNTNWMVYVLFSLYPETFKRRVLLFGKKNISA